jgi:predicted DNA-binding transcriptional regulator AlpA
MPRKLLTYLDLEKRRLGSRSTILRKTEDLSLNFPRPIDTGYGQKRWDEAEIEQWENSRKINLLQPNSTKEIKTTSSKQGFIIVKPGKNGRENTIFLTPDEVMGVVEKLEQASKDWQW